MKKRGEEGRELRNQTKQREKKKRRNEIKYNYIYMYIYIFICLLEIIALPHRETFTVFFFFPFIQTFGLFVFKHTHQKHIEFYIYILEAARQI